MYKTAKAKFESLIRAKKSELAFREFLKGLFYILAREEKKSLFIY